jgi:hypothetical protein
LPGVGLRFRGERRVIAGARWPQRYDNRRLGRKFKRLVSGEAARLGDKSMSILSANALCQAAVLVACFGVAHASAAESPAGARHPAEAALKTVSLFDGKSLEGWVQTPADSWVVKDGAMASTGAGRGAISTVGDYGRFRLLFTMRHLKSEKDHHACVLVFCTRPREGEKPLDALGGIQFQVPLGGHWDYRPGQNDDGRAYFTRLVKPDFDVHQWSRVEILADAATGVARMAVAQPPGSRAVEVLRFEDATAGRAGPVAWQMHNATLLDEFKDVEIEVDPMGDELVTTGK